jgi:hypothetical protein
MLGAAAPPAIVSVRKESAMDEIEEKYPTSHWGYPRPGPAGDATYAELREAGFFRDVPAVDDLPGAEIPPEFWTGVTVEPTPDQVVALLRLSHFKVLRRAGRIVATWDEGRWWTPDESGAHLADLVTNLQMPNQLAETATGLA